MLSARRVLLTIALIATTAFATFTATAADSAPTSGAAVTTADPVAADPFALTEGTLPNGFHYAILPWNRGSGRVSVRLIVKAGSLDEHDDELGYAHFVEHMAFSGTRHYTRGALLPVFQKLGVMWGADANADTSFSHTIYKIDLPANSSAHVAEVLGILRDFADGLLFREADVEKERRVVLSELSARDNADTNFTRRRLTFLYRGTTVPDRMPVGDVDQVRRATASALRAFYSRCYQPQRIAVAIVGDITPVKATELVTTTFGSIPRASTATPRASLRLPPARPLEAAILTRPADPAAAVSLTAVQPRLSPDADGMRGYAARLVALQILNGRLAARRAAEPNRIGSAGASIGEGPDEATNHWNLEAHAATDDWPAALGLLETELRRLREEPVSSVELRENSQTIASVLAHVAEDLHSKLPNELADGLATDLANERPWIPLPHVLNVVEPYLAQLPAEDVTRAANAMFSEDHLSLLLTRAAPLAGGSAEVLAAYRASSGTPLAHTDAATAPLAFRYSDFGAAGKIVERAKDADLGLDLIRFENGVRLTLRRSNQQPHTFVAVARLGRGLADLPPDKPGLLYVAAPLLGRADLGRHSLVELQRLAASASVDLNWSSSDGQLLLKIQAPTTSADFGFAALAAVLSDLKPDAARFDEAVSQYMATMNSFDASADMVTALTTLYQLSGANPRLAVSPPAQVKQWGFPFVAGWMTERWLRGALEIGVCGDFDPDALIAAAARTVGALPARGSDQFGADEKLKFLTRPFRNLAPLPLPDAAATVRIAWPAPQAADPHTFLALRIAADAVVNHVTATLRQKRGATYAPVGGVSRMPATPNFAFVWLQFTCAPAEAPKTADEMLRLVNAFARRGLSSEEFDGLKTPTAARTETDLRENTWWAENILAYAQTTPSTRELGKALQGGFSHISRAEVNQQLAKVFRIENGSVFGVVPQPAKPAAPANAAASAKK